MNTELNKIFDFRKHYNSFLLFSVLVAVFHMFIQLNFNSGVMNIMSEVEYTIPVWFTSLNIIMVLFLFIYQYYLSAYIFDEQVKSYGILFGMGVDRKTFCKFLYKKWCYFFFISVIGGIILGTIMYVLVFNLLEINNDSPIKDMSIGGYILTFVIVFITYIINIFLRIRFVRLANIYGLLCYERKEKKTKYPQICALLGIMFISIGIYFLRVYQTNSYGLLNALVPIVCFVFSAYLLIISFSTWYEQIISFFTKKYLKRLFFLSQLRVDYKKYSKLLILCAISIILGLYILFMNLFMVIAPENYDVENPYDFIVTIGDITNHDIANIQKFEQNFLDLIQKSRLIDLQEAKIKWENNIYDYPINIMPEKSYRELTGKTLDISNDEVVVLTQMNKETYSIGISETNGVEWGFQPIGNTQADINETIYQFKIVREIWEEVYNIEKQDKRTYIISDQYYEKVLHDGGKKQVKYFVEIKEEIQEQQLKLIYSEIEKLGDHIIVKSNVLNSRKDQKYMVSILLFIPTVLIFIALSGLITLRIGQNHRKNKFKYKRLLYLGYTNQQICFELKREIFTLFVIPLTTGTILSVVYTLFSVRQIEGVLLVIIGAIIFIFSCIEYMFYKLTIKKAYKSIFYR